MPPKVQRCIKDMELNEVGYTVPWAMDCEHIVPHDLTLNLTIRGDYTVYPQPMRDTIRMKIVRRQSCIEVYGSTVSDYDFHFSGVPMHDGWHPNPVEWVEG